MFVRQTSRNTTDESLGNNFTQHKATPFLPEPEKDEAEQKQQCRHDQLEKLALLVPEAVRRTLRQQRLEVHPEHASRAAVEVADSAPRDALLLRDWSPRVYRVDPWAQKRQAMIHQEPTKDIDNEVSRTNDDTMPRPSAQGLAREKSHCRVSHSKPRSGFIRV